MDKDRRLAYVAGRIEAEVWKKNGWETIDVLSPEFSHPLNPQASISPAAKGFLGVMEEKIQKNNPPVAALINQEVLLSDSYNPAVPLAKVWLGKIHLTLIERLFDKGFKISLLDEGGNLIQ